MNKGFTATIAVFFVHTGLSGTYYEVVPYDAYARKGKTTGYAGGYLLNLLFASTIGGFWTAKCGKIEIGK